MKLMKTLWVSVLAAGLLAGCAKVEKFKVRFWNGDDLLQSSDVAKGTLPEYKGEVPTKVDETGEFEYTFAGWDPEIVPVEGEASYTAEFDAERVNWSVAERELMEEHLNVVLPYFEETEDGWWYDTKYNCLSTESPLDVADVKAVFAEAKYSLDATDESDPEMLIYEFSTVLENGGIVDIDVYGSAEGSYVDAYYSIEPETIEGVIQEIACGLFQVSEAILGTHYKSDGEGGFWTAGGLGTGTEEDLADVCAYCCSKVPPYMGSPVQGPKAVTLSGGGSAYYAAYVSAKNTVVEILAYLSSGTLVGQFSVYTLEA